MQVWQGRKGRGMKQTDEFLPPPIPHSHTYANRVAVEDLSGLKICTNKEFSSFAEAGENK